MGLERKLNAYMFLLSDSGNFKMSGLKYNTALTSGIAAPRFSSLKCHFSVLQKRPFEICMQIFLHFFFHCFESANAVGTFKAMKEKCKVCKT